jgi:hypothetical protein
MMKKGMDRVFIGWLGLIFFVLCLNAGSVKTPAELSNFTQYSQQEEITRFLSELDQASEKLAVQIIGQTEEVRGYGAKDLYLCVITEEGFDSPKEINREKPTILLIASQHGNEQSAKEAALQLVRDLSGDALNPLLKKINVLIIPQANPFGNQFDQRQNEQDLDLNRDHVKLETPEVKAIHRVFRLWMPEVTMDVHEKGDDYYRVSIGCVSNANIHQNLQDFSRNTILAEVKKGLDARKITFFEYLVTQRMGVDSSAGVRYSPEDQGREETMRRYSTTDLNDGRNSLGIYESLSFIQEGSSRHDLETLEERTRWQYFGIRFFMESIARHAEEVRGMVHDLRAQLLEKAKTFSEDDVVHLIMDYARDEQQPTLIIKKFEREETPIRGILKVDKRAGETISLEDFSPYPYPSRYKVVEEIVQNWFPKVVPMVSVSRPLGYVIPADHADVLETMLDHVVEVDMFTKDIHLDVEAYQVEEVIPSKYDYLPPEKIELKKRTLRTIVKRGDFYISCAQAGANLTPCLLEPQSQYGLIRYWKYKIVPQAGDIFPFYRVVAVEEVPVIPYKNWKR